MNAIEIGHRLPFICAKPDNEPLEKLICNAAREYTSTYYQRMVSAGSKEQLKAYWSWLNRILYFQRAVPDTVFLPQDMFAKIMEQLKLSLLPVSPAHYQETLKRLKSGSHFIENIYMCYSSLTRRETSDAPGPAKTTLIGTVGEGALVLHSWDHR